MNPILIALSLVAVVIGVIWLGLRVRPQRFGQPALSQGSVTTQPLPQGLPAPVERFYRQVYGDQIPMLTSVVITGRGRIRPFGVWMPTRFVLTHETGQNYRHYFEVTFFGVPFLVTQEGIVDGQSFFESPMGTYHNDPNTNQAANIALWAEAGWFPAVWITDRRARWQAVDEHTAILFVPYEHREESFVVRFNPHTGLVDLMEAMRFKAKGDTARVLWITQSLDRPGQPSVAYATWLDDGKPWAALGLEEIRYNLDVHEYIRARGK